MAKTVGPWKDKHKKSRRRSGLEAMLFGSTPGDKFRDKKHRAHDRREQRVHAHIVSGGYAYGERAAYDRKAGRVGAWADDDSPLSPKHHPRTKKKFDLL